MREPDIDPNTAGYHRAVGTRELQKLLPQALGVHHACELGEVLLPLPQRFQGPDGAEVLAAARAVVPRPVAAHRLALSESLPAGLDARQAWPLRPSRVSKAGGQLGHPLRLRPKPPAPRAVALAPYGHTVFRYPGQQVVASQVKCSGQTVWVLFHGGVASSQEAYLGVRSGDAAPFTIDSYSGPWTIDGEKSAYFVGWCPACGYGTVSLTVTRDGGRHFRRYAIRKLTGFRGTGVSVVGDTVTITARSQLRTGPRSRTVTIHVG